MKIFVKLSCVILYIGFENLFFEEILLMCIGMGELDKYGRYLL